MPSSLNVVESGSGDGIEIEGLLNASKPDGRKSAGAIVALECITTNGGYQLILSGVGMLQSGCWLS